MPNSLYFTPLTSVSPTPTQYWRMSTKTASTFNNFLTMDMVFFYTGQNYTIPSGNYMTLFHMGTDAANPGFEVALKNTGSAVQIGLRYSSGTAWTDISSSFYTLSNYTTSAYMVMFTYNYSGSNRILNFQVVRFNTTTYSTPDFSYSTSTGPSVNPGGQWGFGSSPEQITDTTGYISTEEYNSYIAQDVQLFFLRTWNIVIPTTATGTSYGMFNSTDSSYSLYALNKTENTYVPGGTANLQFQLYIPTGNFLISDLANIGTTSNTTTFKATLTTSSSAFPTLANFAVNNSSGLNNVVTSSIPCILKGTKVSTPDGYKLVEDIESGDKIVTHDGRIIDVIKNQLFRCINGGENIPYKILKGTYGAFEDLYISGEHSILVDNEFIVCSKIKDINQSIEEEYNLGLILDYYAINTDDYSKDTIIANGVNVETWAGWSKLPIDNIKIADGTSIVYNSNGNRILN